MEVHRQLRFGAVFVLAYLGFQLAYYALPNATLSQILHHAVLQVADLIIALVRPAEAVSVSGTRLYSSEAALEVIRGCDGSGVAFMVVAAVLALGARTWQRLLLGLLLASLLVYTLNQARIVILYFVLANQPTRFDLIHEYVAPLVMVVLCVGFFVAWSRAALGPVDSPSSPEEAT